MFVLFVETCESGNFGRVRVQGWTRESESESESRLAGQNFFIFRTEATNWFLFINFKTPQIAEITINWLQQKSVPLFLFSFFPFSTSYNVKMGYFPGLGLGLESKIRRVRVRVQGWTRLAESSPGLTGLSLPFASFLRFAVRGWNLFTCVRNDFQFYRR